MAAISRALLDSMITDSLFMTIMGGQIIQYGEGRCELRATIPPNLRNHKGDVHGGLVGALADDACAWACASVTGSVVTAAYTINIMAGASGADLIARGQLLKAGRTLVIGQASLFTLVNGIEKQVALFQGTMVPVPGPAA